MGRLLSLVAVVFVVVSPFHMAWMLYRDFTHPGDTFWDDPRRYWPVLCGGFITLAALAWKLCRLRKQNAAISERIALLCHATELREQGKMSEYRKVLAAYFAKRVNS